MSKYPGRIVSNLAPAGYSVFFDGTGDYLSVADNTALDMGSSDFTIEFWTYLVGTPSTYQAYFAKRANTGTYGGVELYLTSGRTLNLQATLNGSSWGVDITTTSTVPFNTWTHIAAVRNGNTWVVYVNGTAGATSGTVSGTVPDNANTFVIGAGASDGSHVMVASYISNFRVVKGTALYTAAFTPPTQLFNITNTSLLTCNSPAVIDQSTNNFTITANGNAAVSTLTPFTAYVPYNPALGASTPGIWTVDEAMQAAATRQWNMYDPSFNLTTLLLHGNGTNGAQNNTFQDSSSNNFTITCNGNTTQGSFSPFSQTGWSNYFDGSGNGFINVLDAGSVLDLPGDFTLEFWSYQNALATINGTLNLMVSVNTLDLFQIYQDASSFIFIINSATVISTATRPAFNVWNHLALVRSGTTITFYLNGLAVATGSSSFSMTCTSMTIGGQNRTGATSPSSVYHGYNGYMSNFRLVKGTAVYTTNFTPSTTPLTAISGTSLLTCQSNRFVDASSNALSISPVGSTAAVQSFSPFYPTRAYTPETIGGSGYFDGTGDYLISASNAALALGSSDFSIEWWENRNSIGGDDTPVSTGPYASFSACLLGYSGNVGAVGTSGGSGFNVFNFPAYIDTLNPRSWTHFVYTRSGTAFRVFMNGKLSNYATGSGNILQSNNQFCVGGNPGGDQYSVPGYITNFRVVIGSIPTGYQTSSTTPGTVVFTPPTAPPTTTSQGATANDVKLLLNMTNAGVVDSTAKNVLETVGNAQISTTQSVFGGTSMSFNGTNSTLLLRSSQLMNLGASDFTLELWMYRSAATASQPLYSLNGSSQTNVLALDMGASGNLLAYTTASGGGTWSLLPGVSFGTVPLTTWTHIALVRNGSTWRGYLNGVVGFTVTNSSAIASFDGLSIGSSGASTLWFNGFIDDFRITRFARYTAAFTPQTSQWQDQ